ncbi:MAG: hypothetical protein JNG84_15315, partial [Archangium sp.]|nr:hypothetical protein [Archangium sp.]
MNRTKALFLTVVTVAAVFASALPFLSEVLALTDAPVPSGTRFLVALSAIANVAVIAYHYLVPPHPKFLMVPWRRAILRVHITSGTVEFIAGIVALTSAEPEVPARVMAAAALLFHIPSAFAQTPIVFGARAIMRPGYLLCIGVHALCAVKLWLHPGSAYWVASTFLVFNVYVWCRVYYFIFDKVGLFAGARYSVSILAAGLTTTPALLGPNAILVLFTGVAVYLVCERLFFSTDSVSWAEVVREKARDSALPDDVRALFSGEATESDASASDEFFTRLDRDGDGVLRPAEVKQAMADAMLAPSMVDRFYEARIRGEVTREVFREVLWPLREIRDRAFLVKALAAARSERDKAELVFQ